MYAIFRVCSCPTEQALPDSQMRSTGDVHHSNSAAALPEQSTRRGEPFCLSYRQVWKRTATAKAYIYLTTRTTFLWVRSPNKFSPSLQSSPALSPLSNEIPRRLCFCHSSLPSCAILTKTRPCGIYSTDGNQGPIT